MIRKLLSALCMLAVLLFGFVTLTVPAIAATGPAIITIAFAGAAYFLWPKHRAKDSSAVPPAPIG